MLNLYRPFEVFIDEKYQSDQDGKTYQEECQFPVSKLYGGNRHGDGHTAGEQQQSIDSPEGDVELFSGQMESSLMIKSDNRINNKKPPEKQQFGEDKKPHANFGGSGIKMFRMGNCL